MARPAIPCPVCAHDHLAQLVELEQSLAGGEAGVSLEEAQRTAKALYRELDQGDLGNLAPDRNRMVSARPKPADRDSKGRGVAARP